MSTTKVTRNMLDTGIVDNSNATAITIDSSEDVTLAGNLLFADSKKAKFGAGSDLNIYHDGSDSYITDTGTGNLLIQYSDLYFSKDAGSTHSVVFRSTGNVGIGTTNPSRILHTEGSSVLFGNTSGAHEILFGDAAHRYFKLYTPSSPDYASIRTGTTDILVAHSDGKVGIGTTSPGALLTVVNSATTSTAHFQGSTNSDTFEHLTLKSTVDNNPSYVNMVFESGQGKLAKIQGRQIAGGGNAYGDMVFYTSNNGTMAEKFRVMYNGRQVFNGSSTVIGHANFVGEVGTNSKAVGFEHTNGGGEVGSISTGSSSTAFNTSSDYRLKENVDYTWDATTRLKQLKPARFNFIIDETNTLVDGFLAHEVSSIVPEAITGEKDAMSDPVLYTAEDELPEGKNIGDVKTAAAPEYQGIDQSKLVPLLVKTIQELEARITTLEG